MRVRLRQDRLNGLIARSNLSQNHWAIKLGLSRGHWSGIVNGRHPYPSARTRGRILEIFGVAFDQLFEVERGPPAWSDQNFQAAIADRYLIDKEIGQGGMGTVFLARDFKHGRQVAVKVLSPEVVSGIGVEQFLKEIRYTARLQHHHILPLFDSGEAAGSPFYVMPFLVEGSLRQRLEERGQLAVSEAIILSRGVAAALTHAHTHHVLHCDVKPENVLLSEDHAFVADFGVSRAIHAEALEWGRRAELDSSAGTPAYVSPEQATGDPGLDARADVYSLGCMVFEMMAGHPPFTGRSTMEIVSKRFVEDVPNLRHHAPHVPEAVASAVAGAMELHARRRYQSVAEFMQTFEDAAKRHDSPIRESLRVVTTRLTAAGRRAVGAKPGTRSDWSKTRKMFDSLKQDLGYAIRTLRRARGFSAVVVLTLAFGIAANTFVFSLLSPYFLRPLPFSEPERLVHLGMIDQVTGWDRVRFSPAMYADYAERSRSFSDVAYYVYGSVTLTGAEGPERVSWSLLSANTFAVLGAGAAIGRTFQGSEGGPGRPDVVVLSDRLWQRRFGGDATLIGRTIEIDGTPHEVIGVMPPRFNFPFGSIELWVPSAADPVSVARARNDYEMFGRLADGVTEDQARAEVNRIHADLAQLYPDIDGEFSGVSLKPIRESLNFAWGILRMAFSVMLGAVAFALILACVNVASLSLARATARTGEVAVRAALGAGRIRIVRQLITESVVLAIAGAVLGVGIAHVLVRAVGPLIPLDLYRVGDASIDMNVLLFTLGVTALTPLFFGLAPAIAAARTNLSATLKEGGRGGVGRSTMLLRRILVVSEIALAVVLIAGMGLMMRSLQAVQRMDLGYDTDRTLIAEVTLPSGDYPESADYRRYYRAAEEKLRGVSGVREVGRVHRLPLNHETGLAQFAKPGQEPPRGDDWPVAVLNRASPDYFAAMDITVHAGRSFRDEETDGSTVVISRTLADRLWPNENAVGQSVLWGEPDAPAQATVIGVVADVKHQEFGDVDRPQLYLPFEYGLGRRQFLVVGTEGGARAVMGPVQRALRDLDANLPFVLRPMGDVVAENTVQWRISSGLLLVLGVASVLLASLGIYGMLAFSVVQRRKEIGLRMALGANEGLIGRRFLKEGMRLGGIGVVIGLGLSVFVGKFVSGLLFGVSAVDPVTLVGAAVIFSVVSIFSSVVPARRASRVDPLTVLRYE